MHTYGFVFLCVIFVVSAEIDLSIYANQFELSDNERYTVYWNYNETHIELAVKAKSTGWVGLGFSKSGGMLDADAVIGSVYDNGTVVLDDYYVDARTALCTQSGGVCPDSSNRIKGQNNIIDYDGEISNGYTILSWIRLLNTNDTNGDVVLSPDNPIRTLTWAYHPTSKILVYHNPDTHGYQLVELFHSDGQTATTDTVSSSNVVTAWKLFVLFFVLCIIV